MDRIRLLYFEIVSFHNSHAMVTLSGMIFILNFSLVWQGVLHNDDFTNRTYCVYESDVATGYGVGAFLFLLSSESLLMGVTKCMCFGRPLAPGGNRAWTIIYFVSSW